MFPPYVPVRSCSAGGAMVLEAASLLKIRLTLNASKSLVWDANGYRFEKRGVSRVSELGSEIEIAVPSTDVQGWRDPATNALIDVSAPGSYTHRYTATIEFLDENDRSISVSPVKIGPFVVPSGDDVLDLDKLLPATNVAGELVQVPDRWGQLVAQAEAAAAEARAALVDSTEFVRTQIAEPGPVRDELTATIVDVVESTVPTGVVTSTNIQQMLATNDPDATLENGIVFVYEERAFFTDFSGGLTEVAHPWAAGTWTAETGVTGASGQVIRKSSGLSPATGRRAAQVIDAPAEADVEVVARVKINAEPVSSQINTAIVMRASGSADAENGVYIGLRADRGIYIAELRNGAGVDLTGAQTAFPVTPGVWFWIRARLVGTTLQVRMWNDAEPEPVTWNVTRTSITITSAGWIGVMASAAVEQDFDRLGVGYDGAAAPKEAP